MARIGYVSPTTGAHDEHWVRTLRAGGHDVRVYAPHDIGQGDELLVAGPLTDAGAAAVRVGPTLGLSWAFDLLVDAEEPAAARVIADTLSRLVWLHADARAIADRAVQFGADGARISVAAWGIDTTFFTPGERVPDEGVPATEVVFSARSWEPIYDVGTVVRGFAVAHAARPGLRLVLGGTGSQREEVLATIDECGVADAVEVVGRLDRVGLREQLRRAAVYVSAARSDGTSLSLLEALAVGVPAVVTDVGGNPEWVDNDVLGRLFRIGDADELATALLSVLDDPALDEPGDVHAAEARRAAVVARGDLAVTQPVLLNAVDRVLAEQRS